MPRSLALPLLLLTASCTSPAPAPSPLAPAPSNQGGTILVRPPEGKTCDVLLNKLEKGRAPVEIRALLPGDYLVELRCDGQDPFSTDVHVTGDEEHLVRLPSP